jgi:hypothetical protein
MIRRLLNLISVLSLLLCVAVVALWVRGYWESDLLGYVAVRADGGRFAGWVCSGRGGVGFTFSSIPPGVVKARGPSWRRGIPRYGGTDWPDFASGGVGFYAAARRNPATGVRVVGACLPSPVVVAASAAAALPALYAKRRRWRDTAALCPCCGYDLRATPGRCPECGTASAV